MHRTLYTWHAENYRTTLYAHADTPIAIAWVVDADTPAESSGLTQAPAHAVQEQIQRLERAGYVVESIYLI